ncbi:MAG: hypothetical protein DBX55_04445 [Verrucomicrobia bacterium]|nr:MAG: hypothetical protein DBX55_04445 [Verrucomicrobiota bacterium]
MHMRYFAILSVFALPVCAWAQNVAIADMQQDISLMRREIADLKTEVEQLRREAQSMAQRLAKYERASSAGESAAIQIAGVRSQTASQMEAMKREIVEQVRKDIEALANQTNRQMSKLADAVGKVPQQEVQKTFSEDYPKTGITYTVKSGDYLTKIARENNSRVKWIQDANRIADPSRGLRAGDQIFIPQK